MPARSPCRSGSNCISDEGPVGNGLGTGNMAGGVIISTTVRPVLDRQTLNPGIQHRCSACNADRLYEIAGFRHLPRVTSDSKPFRPGGRLFVCEFCGTVQKIVDPLWLAEIGEIYRN